MQDNLLYATNVFRTSILSLRKKTANMRSQLESLDIEIGKIEDRCDKIITQAEVYKVKLQREMSREVRRLERELATLRKSIPSNGSPFEEISPNELKIASTIGVFDSILRHISVDAEDFRMASEAFLFPAVFERVMTSNEEAYFLEEVPACMELVINRGREYVEWVRSEFYTHLTNPETWDIAVPQICDWWRNDALPIIYGARDEQWDIDEPLTLTEMMLWRDSPADRPLQFSAVFDAFEIYQKHKDTTFQTSGLKEFEIQWFARQK